MTCGAMTWAEDPCVLPTGHEGYHRTAGGEFWEAASLRVRIGRWVRRRRR